MLRWGEDARKYGMEPFWFLAEEKCVIDEKICKKLSRGFMS